jgi:DNA repair protein RadC
MQALATRQSYILRDNSANLEDGEVVYNLRVRDMAENDKPREKLMAAGPGSLGLAELLAVVWGVGTRKEDVLAMSRRIMHEYGGYNMAHETSPAKISEVLGIPIQKACQLVASFELGRRFYAQRAGKPVFVRTASQAYQYVRTMAISQKEQLRGLYLNSRYEVIHDEVISVGSLTASIVHPREVFRPAIDHGAVAVVIAHNHPSEDTTPTAADLEITAQLKAAGALLGIDLLDHLIVTSRTFRSISPGKEPRL